MFVISPDLQVLVLGLQISQQSIRNIDFLQFVKKTVIKHIHRTVRSVDVGQRKHDIFEPFAFDFTFQSGKDRDRDFESDLPSF